MSLSLVVLLGAFVVVLWRDAGLRTWHAVVYVLFGFFLASTAAAPFITAKSVTWSSSSRECACDHHREGRHPPPHSSTTSSPGGRSWPIEAAIGHTSS